MRLTLLQHVAFEGAGAIGDWAQTRGHTLAVKRLDLGHALPDANTIDALIVMGGPMGVYDDASYPWLAAEKRLIGDAIQAGRHVLGICLGAQLIASVLGADVTRNPEREIGWFPVEWTQEARGSRTLGFTPPVSNVFHWHGDTFSLPAGAQKIARSAACAEQGFLFHDERVLALQFHLEMRPVDVRGLVEHGRAELMPASYVQNAMKILLHSPQHCRATRALLDPLLDRWSGLPR
jgi:GMP synthase (glutamine-hydrolysing)